ncbi:MAG: 4Fe-4S ferredoxin [Chloroflexi bacterium HGW-Chloroflexi-6]|nr:MAG: 4Fe-4S ferredoxin [Chloroflexi bacterium HGW-Chloroflexi-6]
METYGKGILKGLMVTAKRFIDTYLEDIKWWGRKRYFSPEGIAHRGSKDAKGIFTVQYPEEKVPVPEEFRYIPFLVYDEGENGSKDIRCTSCGICAKACPPQCIWIVRGTDPVTGRPVQQPAEFYIDADICMNCGFCAEYCPFDAIKMDHDYEISSYGRNLLDKEALLKSAKYYAEIRPQNNAREEIARAEKAAAKAAAKAAEAG